VLRTFVDGLEVHTDNTSKSDPRIRVNTDVLKIAKKNAEAVIDEARVSCSARSADWIKTEYNNQSSPAAFYTLGPEETGATQYTLTASAGEGGTITPVGEVTVDAGQARTFDIVADTGYAISDVIVDGVSKGVVSSWAFNNVLSDHEITVSFEADSGGGGAYEGEPLTGCGANSVLLSYHDGFAAEALDLVNTQLENGQVVLKTGFAAIDKENIIIPFEQEVFVNMLLSICFM
jgi:hypothetical protein